MKNQLLWLDMEMTGLDVEKEVVIEVAALVSDLELNVDDDSYEAVVKQPDHFIQNMDDWNTKHHTESGLVAKIPTGKSPETVEDELLAFIDKHFEEPPVLAGNSIHQDRKFITKYFKKLDDKIHYRMLDVSSWKVMFKDHFGKEFEKTNQHRALDDIRESIAELKFYMGFIKT